MDSASWHFSTLAALKRLIEFLFVITLLDGCGGDSHDPVSTVDKNMTRGRVSGMSWENHPIRFEVADSTLSVTVEAGTDYFNDPEDGTVVGSAPFLFEEVEGDFVMKALVEPDFSSQWNAVSLMVYRDSLNWIKFAFENSDATGPGIVSVVTKGSSDDANGAILEGNPHIWLAIARKDDIYAMHWSQDGETYAMARLASLPGRGTIKAGIEAQAPVGTIATHRIHYFQIDNTTVNNLRDLNE